MPRLLYVMPRMYLLGSGLADVSPSLSEASLVPVWLWLGHRLAFYT